MREETFEEGKVAEGSLIKTLAAASFIIPTFEEGINEGPMEMD